jgi:hypothetical protein
VIFIIIYAGIGLSVSFYVCRFILTNNYCVIKNVKTTFDNSEIIQTIIKVLNCADGYKIIFLSRLTPVREKMILFFFFVLLNFIFNRFHWVYKMDFIQLVISHFALIYFGPYVV